MSLDTQTDKNPQWGAKKYSIESGSSFWAARHRVHDAIGPLHQLGTSEKTEGNDKSRAVFVTV